MASSDILIVNKITPAHWKATLNNGPLNLFSPELYAALRFLLDDLESDEDVRVIVFDSSVPNYFCAHLDILRSTEKPIPRDPFPLSQTGRTSCTA